MASPQRATSLQHKASTQLNVGMALDWNPVEDEYFLMKKAQACADSDSCSLEDAKGYLDDVIHIQSGCASGVLLGSDVCSNVDSAVETVANLRAKIERETIRVIAINSGAGASVGIALLSIFVAGMVAANPEVAPFTPQEWWWALRDGYLPTMLGEYFKYGGLATMDYDPETTPFALQEWWWAMKGGYLNTIVEHYFRNGGLATTAGFEADTVALTPQEWIWAIRDGYLPAMLEQNFQSGGLPGGPIDNDVLPFPPQEWIWALRGNFASEMADSYFRNGGL